MSTDETKPETEEQNGSECRRRSNEEPLEVKPESCNNNIQGTPVIVTYKIANTLADGQTCGDCENHLMESSKADFHTYNTGTANNQGYKELIPIEKFTLKHLPESYRDKELYELIKATADLTVKVDVKKISPYRPGLWPKRNVPFPFYRMEKLQNFTIGSGMIKNVAKFTDGVCKNLDVKIWKGYKSCWCKNCKDLHSPSNVWWEFDVDTAAHVVFDDIEASHTSLRLFYDSDDTDESDDGLNVIVANVNIVYVNIDKDTSMLKSVTCNKSHGDKLEKLWNHYNDKLRRANKKYQASCDVDKLTFLVSYPHDGSKQISVSF